MHYLTGFFPSSTSHADSPGADSPGADAHDAAHQRSRLWLKLMRCLLAVYIVSAATVATGATVAETQEYSLQADADFGMLHIDTSELAATLPEIGSSLLLPYLNINADHRLSYDWGELAVRHSLTGPDQALASDQTPVMKHELQQFSAYLWALDPLSLQLGRFSVPWSFGYLFQPGDIINKPGESSWFDGAALAWMFSPDWSLSGVLRADTAYGKSYEDIRWGLKLNGYIAAVEAQLAAVYQPDSLLRPSAGLSFSLGPFVLHIEGAVELSGNAPDDPIAPGDIAATAASGDPMADLSPGHFASDLQVLRGDETGFAVNTGLNWQQYLSVHGISLLIDYVYTSTEIQGLGNQLMLIQAGYDFDRRFAAEQNLVIAAEAQRAELLSSLTASPWDSFEITAGLMASSDFGADSITDWWTYRGAYIGTRIFY